MTLNQIKAEAGTTINEYYTGSIAVFTLVGYKNDAAKKAHRKTLRILLADPRNNRFGEVTNMEAKRYFGHRIVSEMLIRRYTSGKDAMAALNSYRNFTV